jgi:hypothetical protein
MVMARSKEGLLPIEITCFYEELPMLGIGVVGQAKPRLSPSINTSTIGRAKRFGDFARVYSDWNPR